LVIGSAGIAIEQNAVSGASVIMTFRSGPSAVMLVILPIFMEGVVPWPNSIISRLVSELFGHTEAFGGEKPPGRADFVLELS
jgi:hypothetical protein